MELLRILPAFLVRCYRECNLLPERGHAYMTPYTLGVCGTGVVAARLRRSKKPYRQEDNRIAWDALQRHGYDEDYISGFWQGFDDYPIPSDLPDLKDRRTKKGRGYWDGVACWKACKAIFLRG